MTVSYSYVWKIVKWFWGSVCYLPGKRTDFCFWHAGDLEEEYFSLVWGWVDLQLYLNFYENDSIYSTCLIAQPLMSPVWKLEVFSGILPLAGSHLYFLNLLRPLNSLLNSTQLFGLWVAASLTFQPLDLKKVSDIKEHIMMNLAFLFVLYFLFLGDIDSSSPCCLGKTLPLVFFFFFFGLFIKNLPRVSCFQ